MRDRWGWTRCRGARAPLALTALLAGAMVAAGCQSSGWRGGLDLERMYRQKRGDAYDASDVFPDGKVMRTPPNGTVVHDTAAPPASVRTGRRDGDWVRKVPVRVTLDRLRRGQDRFGVYCSPCHGMDGNALTPVAGVMRLKRPPSLHADVVRNMPDGMLFEIIRRGYGLMPSYGAQLPVQDRWDVVAYVRALELSQNLHLDSVPADLRSQIEDRLPEGGDGGGSP